jgi:hypothetical protein
MTKPAKHTLSLLIAILCLGPPAAALAAAPTASPGEALPYLLLQSPGWRIQHANFERGRKGVEGSVEFVTGKPIPYEAITISGKGDHEKVSGMQPAAERQRRVEVSWRHEGLAEVVARAHESQHPHGQKWVELPVLGTTAQVDTRAEFWANVGGPGDRQMTAYWEADGLTFELRASVPDQAAFEERLGWLTEAEEAAWLAALPRTVVAPAQRDSVVAEMLRGIPTPKTFRPARVEDEGLPTDRYQVGADVTGTVACLWLRQWGAARRTGDKAAAAEAVKAMGTSKHWQVLHEMATGGAYPQVLWEIAEAMPSGVWTWAGKTHRLLPHAEGLGCARRGLPLTAKKMKLQRKRAKS